MVHSTFVYIIRSYSAIIRPPKVIKFQSDYILGTGIVKTSWSRVEVEYGVLCKSVS